MAKGFDPLALFAPMLGLTKDQLDGLRDPAFQQSLVRTWEGLRSIDPGTLQRIEQKLAGLDAKLNAVLDNYHSLAFHILAGVGDDDGLRAITGKPVAGPCSDPDDGATGGVSQDRAA